VSVPTDWVARSALWQQPQWPRANDVAAQHDTTRYDTRHDTRNQRERALNTQEVERDFACPEENDGHGLEGVLVGLRYGLLLRVLDRFTWRSSVR
jgi:hypothetical protein